MSENVVAFLDDAVVVRAGFPLLAGASLRVEAQRVSVLTGPNGAGKTSLLRLLGGFEALSSGEGMSCGIDVRRGDRRELRRRVGWLGHEGPFYDDLTVGENLTFATKALGLSPRTIADSLERVGLANRLSVRTGSLSAGQRRRLGLAWLLVRRPTLWLLDEPYATLDDEARDFFDALIAGAVAQGASVVASAHDPLRSAALEPVNFRVLGGRVVS